MKTSIKKHSPSLLILVTSFLLISCSSISQISDVDYNFEDASLLPPESIKTVFEETYDPDRSDNFNNDKLNTDKWTFRTQGGNRWLTIDEVNWRKGKNINYGLSDKNSNGKYISIKASAKGEDKGSDALTSKFSTKYGFYIAKFRAPGLKTNVRPIHHPAIWSAWKNFSDIEYKSISGYTTPSKWMEVDFIELYDNAPAWKMLTLAHDKNPEGGWIRGKQFAMDERDLTETATNWQTIGFEFRKDFIRFWRFKNGDWEAEPKTIKIIEGSNNKSVTNPTSPDAEIGKLNVDREMYWIISNVRFKPLSERDSDDDVYFEIDHFLYFPLK